MAKAFQRPADRPAHAKALQEALCRAEIEATERRAATGIAVHGAEPGLYIQFESPPGVELKLESFEDRRKGIELVAVKSVQPEPEGELVQLATDFGPHRRIEVDVPDLASLRLGRLIQQSPLPGIHAIRGRSHSGRPYARPAWP